MIVDMSTKVRLSGKTAKDIREMLEGIPDDAKVSVYHYKADFRDPRESDYTDLTFSWKETRGNG